MSKFLYSVGPWNVNTGEDSYGPSVRTALSLEEKVKTFARLGFAAVQFHDDDAVPEMNDMSVDAIRAEAARVRELLDTYGLKAEFVAPRLWMDPRTTDGGYTSNNPEDRKYAMWRSERSIDIANILGCDKIVLWLAREGTMCAESKNPVESIRRLISSINRMLDYDRGIKVLIESKPNEPIDRSFCGTIGHVVGLSACTKDPSRVGALLESAHAVLCGLDPANEMAFALAAGKLWGVHLNDQNGVKFDQDKSFGSENLRSAFNQVKVLCENNYGADGEYVGLDVKSMRTTKDADAFVHLENSLKIARLMEEKVSKFDYEFQQQCIERRDYERLEMYVLNLLLN